MLEPEPFLILRTGLNDMASRRQGALLGEGMGDDSLFVH